MQYRYTLTRRLLAVGTISLLLLLTLLFLLGVQIGRLMAEPGGPPAAPGLATFAPVVPEPLAVPAPPGAAAPDQRTALADPLLRRRRRRQDRRPGRRHCIAPRRRGLAVGPSGTGCGRAGHGLLHRALIHAPLARPSPHDARMNSPHDSRP